MKDTIKNSIIGAFAIFGFITLISSSNTAPNEIQETKQVYTIIATDGGDAYKLNRETGEVWWFRTNRYMKVHLDD